MLPNSFEVRRVRAYAGPESGAGDATESKGVTGAVVRPLNSTTPGCITIAVGDIAEPAAGPVAEIDIARGVAVEVSYAMNSHFADDTPATIAGVARGVRAYRADGTEYFSAEDIGFQMYGSNRHGEWHIHAERRGPGRAIEASLTLRFDWQNALMLAELLRTMPFR